MTKVIVVRHNIEVAHRLWQLEGDKCQNIHGHSMWVEMQLEAPGMEKGIATDGQGKQLDFGSVKGLFRRYLDETYDHHLLLHKDDPFACPLVSFGSEAQPPAPLPGLLRTPDDPSTENIAQWIARWSSQMFKCNTIVRVNETHVNAAIAFADWDLDA